MKKQIISALVAILLVGSMLAGCGPEKTQETEPSVAPTAAQAETSEPTVPETSEPTVPATSEPTVPENTEADTTEAPADNQAETPSGKYVDLDNMQFAINGKTYTLGKTTLQELIDDGVPFREGDVANASNNLSKNSQSGGFRIVLGEYWTAQVFAFNDTDAGKPASECYINEVYLPVHKDETQDILTFAFPQNMTVEELRANAGEPTKEQHYDGDNGYYSDKLEYTKESTKYYGDSGYVFDFMKGVLDIVTIEYLP